MKKHTLILIIGIVIFLIGAAMNSKYESDSITVSATITDIDTKDTTDDGPISYRHKYYGTYTVDGKEYSDKHLTTMHTSDSRPDHKIGESIEIRVDGNNPNKMLPEGGVLGVIGLLITIYGIVVTCRERKKEKQATSQPQ